MMGMDGGGDPASAASDPGCEGSVLRRIMVEEIGGGGLGLIVTLAVAIPCFDVGVAYT